MEEQELVRNIKAGDGDAFEALYRLYADGALRTAHAVVFDRMTAADAVQETFVRVYRHIGSYDESRPFRSWFHAILINECNRSLKKQAKAIPMELDESRHLPAERDTYAFEEEDALYRLVRELEEPFRLPIVLKYVNDLTDREIADVMGLNVNTVKSRLHQGKKKLKTRMIRDGGGNGDG
ncbi:sigma-70 family RNA polymerase sigma factor [Paenibacillus antri]|uniref:Sigma-70 family RNA polymerase sigma factor n=1 Tax=Paenibacillus antri TaxID=2582848 RepID=A0A5R9GDM5_9BACL|nr:sigma-70 family RNA polymerase sigma factor [Paenibacillus antri]TLS51294.1 sigma-70 family RNA polymerase sigma factor [Paenibacillus antri]